jgi:hypothetical protein
LEVVDEDLLQILRRVDEIGLEALDPGEWYRFQSHREVDDLGGVGATGHLSSSRVTTNPLPWVLLTEVLGDAD